MESPGNPRIKPPDANDKKKAGGSFAKRNIWLIGVLAGVLLIGGVSWFIYKEVKRVTHFQKMVTMKVDSIDNDDFDKAFDADTVRFHYTIFAQPYSQSIRSAKLDITAGAVSFGLVDTCSDKLLEAKCEDNHNKFKLDSHKRDSLTVIDFIAEKTSSSKIFTGHLDSVNFKLSARPEWQFDIKAGATHTNLDLSKFKVRSIKLEGGAGDYILKLGQPSPVTDISISTGASEVSIKIPKDVACHIKLDSGLSSSTFDGFGKKGENEYETSGFDKAKNKIFIEFTGAISDYKVDRY